MLFVRNSANEWCELDINTLKVFNFSGGFHTVTKEELKTSEILECKNWHELYLKKGYCPLEVTAKRRDVWVSPVGKFYSGDAHEIRANELLEIIYGEPDVEWAGDRLEELGWIRATASLMWEVRTEADYWNNKKISQKQYDALWDWCKLHAKSFPQDIEIA